MDPSSGTPAGLIGLLFMGGTPIMKFFKRALCLMLAILMTGLIMAGAAPAQAVGNSVEMGDVIQLGDWEAPSLHIVFYPKALESSDQTWPVIVWANGTCCAPILYTGLLKGLAAKGFVVITNSDVMAANGTSQRGELDYILAENERPGSVFYGKIDPSRLAAVGHSQGGRSVVNACADDPRFGCAVSIAGSPYTKEAKRLSTPTLFLTGSSDLVVLSSLWVKPAYKNCKGPAVYASLKGGVHTSCILNPEKYIDLIALWINGWFGNSAALQYFYPGGGFPRNSAWKDYASKNLP